MFSTFSLRFVNNLPSSDQICRFPGNAESSYGVCSRTFWHNRSTLQTDFFCSLWHHIKPLNKLVVDLCILMYLGHIPFVFVASDYSSECDFLYFFLLAMRKFYKQLVNM